MTVAPRIARAAPDRDATATHRLSLVMEWANTIYHGAPRAHGVFEEVERQWRQVIAGEWPADLPPEARAFLAALDPRAEALIVSGEPIAPETEAWLSGRDPSGMDARILFAAGLEYYPLKNLGLRHAEGDVVLFLDCDVLPDPGWLAHLLGSFGRPDVCVVAGQPYVSPRSLVSRAFALGWSYDRRRPGAGVVRSGKFFANNIAFRGEVIRPTGFPDIGPRTRGALRLLRADLARRGIPTWVNLGAHVAHPPPLGVRHMVVRALAHGRDTYMRASGRRSWRGLKGSVGTAARRWWRGMGACVREAREVGLRAWQVPAAMAIISAYYVGFALGGIYTFARPADAGRRFRV